VGDPDALEEPKKANLTLLQKLKLYNGKSLPGFTEDNVRELRDEARARAWKASRRATSRTRSATRWSAGFRAVHQPVHGDERARGGACPPQPDHDEECKKRYATC
jgi:hypothetical protein